jgi:purine-binding chemotaxis protein CheW
MNRGRAGPGQPIDWGRVHAQLGRAEEAAREALHPSAARIRDVLDERARRLARVPDRRPDAAEVLEVATFSLDDERYAIETRHVRRVARLGDCVPLPGAPEALVGVINSGGEILAVFDLRVLFGRPRGRPNEPTYVIILGDEREEFGILADVAHEVVTMRVDAILAPSAALDDSRRHLLLGVTEEALVVFDGDALLGDERLIIDQGDDLA